jgi:diguanylate cyclase (GGDEF)-like protein
MFKFRSLATRFSTSIVLTGVIVFSSLTAVTVMKLREGVAEQSEQLGSLSKVKLAERLDANAKLARARLDRLLALTESRLDDISQRLDVNKAIASGNIVAMSEVLKPAAALAGLDSILVVDADLHVIGAATGAIDLLAANKAIHGAEFVAGIGDLLHINDRTSPRQLRRVLRVDAATNRALGEPIGSIADVVVSPLFDDFGDVMGALVATRVIKQQESELVEFANLTKAGVLVVAGEKRISSAGLGGSISALINHSGAPFGTTADGQFVARCVPFETVADVCALAPVSDLFVLRDEMVRIGEQQNASLARWLTGFATFAILLFAAISIIVGREVTRPLRAITSAVTAVSKGEQQVTVLGEKRGDEIGDIAKAVTILQHSVAERDQLRLNVMEQNRTLVSQEEQLLTQNLRFDAALSNMSHGLCMFDATQRLIVSNRRFLELYGFTAEEIQPGARFEDILALSCGRGTFANAEKWRRKQRNLVRRDEAISVIQELADGRVIAVSHQPMPSGGWVATYADITERRRGEARIAHMARHDALTDLPNRLLFRERMEQELDQVKGEVNGFAVMCLDLDAFKTVNDTFGHPIGDALLVGVAHRLRGQMRNGDIVARLGGDEFAIILGGSVQSVHAETVAANILESMAQPYQIDGHEISIGVSIGIAYSHRDGDDADHLLKNADLALYAAKSDGRNTYRSFEIEMDAKVRARRVLEVEFRAALTQNEFQLHYQPIVNVAANRVVGFEALVRWRHPVRGMVSPGEFIPFAEETGLIVPLGEWVVREACREASSWPSDLKVAVNVSPIQISNPNLASVIMNAVASAGIPANRLELEITESALLQEDPVTFATLLNLKQFGIRFSMDDFGTGYSSLKCLHRFPFDKIKLDQSFIRGLPSSSDGLAIVRAVIGLGGSLNMTITAEGVETAEQLDLLRAEGCGEVQGYFLGRPKAAADMAELLRQPLLQRVA